LGRRNSRTRFSPRDSRSEARRDKSAASRALLPGPMEQIGNVFRQDRCDAQEPRREKAAQTSVAFYCPERCERVSRLRSYRVVGISLGGANYSLRDHITAVSFELWRDRYQGRAEHFDFGPHVLQSRQPRIAVGSPLAPVETYCDRPLFEHRRASYLDSPAFCYGWAG
jgi:hypothetical protein